MSQKLKTADSLGHVLETLWLLTLFALPLIFWPTLSTTFELPKVVFFHAIVWLMFLLWLIKIAIEKKITVPVVANKNLLLLRLFGVLFVAFYVLATIFSINPLVSIWGLSPRFQGLYTFATYLLFGTIIFFNLTEEKQVNRLLNTIFLAAAVTGTFALLQKFLPGFLNFWDDGEFPGRVFGTMGNPNYLAGWLVTIIPLMLTSLSQKKNGLRILASMSFILSTTALFFTFTRAAYLGFLIAVIFLMLMAYRLKQRKLFWTAIIFPLVMTGLLVSINIFAGSQWANPFLNRFTLQEGSFSSVESRLQIWPATMRQILDQPILGYGPETFALTFPKYAPPQVNTIPERGAIPDRTHNEILDTAVQIGIPGLLAYLAFLLMIFIENTRMIMQKSYPHWLVLLGLLSGLLALLVTNQFGFSVTVNWVYFYLFVAIIIRLLVNGPAKTIAMSRSKIIAAIIITTILASLSVAFQDTQNILQDLEDRQQITN